MYVLFSSADNAANFLSYGVLITTVPWSWSIEAYLPSAQAAASDCAA